MIRMQHCRDGCCTIKIKDYINIPRYFNRNYRKAGVFIYDPNKDMVLLVQSCGNLWGPPKGTLNNNESSLDGAIRELREETGLIVNPSELKGYVEIKNRATYYYLEKDYCDIEVQDSVDNNDANGIAWIRIECLENAILDGNIILNHYAKLVFSFFLEKTFQKCNWITVKRK